jgi:hypothetical protein
MEDVGKEEIPAEYFYPLQKDIIVPRYHSRETSSKIETFQKWCYSALLKAYKIQNATLLFFFDGVFISRWLQSHIQV